MKVTLFKIKSNVEYLTPIIAYENNTSLTLDGLIYSDVDNGGVPLISKKKPVITIYSEESIDKFNYCKFKLNNDTKLFTYYHIIDITNRSDNLYELSLEYDYLYNNKEEIMSSRALINNSAIVPAYVENPGKIKTNIVNTRIRMGSNLESVISSAGAFSSLKLDNYDNIKYFSSNTGGTGYSRNKILRTSCNNFNDYGPNPVGLSYPGNAFYHVDDSYDSVLNALYTTDFTEEIERKYFNKASEGVLSFRSYPLFDFDSTNSSHPVKIGSTTLGNDVSAKSVNSLSNYKSLYIWNIMTGNRSDYKLREPYTNVEIFIPGYGFKEISTNYLFNRTVEIRYQYDVFSTKAKVDIWTYDYPGDSAQWNEISFGGSKPPTEYANAVHMDTVYIECGLDIPLDISSIRSGSGIAGNIATGAGSGALAGAIAGSAVPGVGTLVGSIGGGLVGGAGGAMRSLSSYTPNINKTGGENGQYNLNNGSVSAYAVVTNIVEDDLSFDHSDYAKEYLLNNLPNEIKKKKSYIGYVKPDTSNFSSNGFKFSTETLNRLYSGVYLNTSDPDL